MHKEVELTAEIDKKQYETIHNYLSKNLKKTASERLFMIRFHKGDKLNQHDPLDIRYKWRNGNNKLVVKKGALGSQSRKEFNVSFAGNELQNVVPLFMLLGYKTANAMYREIERFENKTIEAALAKAGPYYFIEVEALSVKIKKEALATVTAFFKKLNLKPLSKNDYHKFIRRLDREVNLNFPLEQFPHPLLQSPEWKAIVEKTVLGK